MRVKKISRKISMLAAFLMLFNIIFQFGGGRIAYASTFAYTACYPTPQDNNVKFIVKYDGIGYAYAVGDFNNWGDINKDGTSDIIKNDLNAAKAGVLKDYLLEWKPDSCDNVWKMMNSVPIPDGIQEGNIKYKFVLSDGNWINKDGVDGSNSTFYWNKFQATMEIKASSNTVSSSRPVDLVSVKKELKGNTAIVDVAYSIEPNVVGAKIENNQLKVDEAVVEGTNIVVKAIYNTNALTVTKTFTVNNENSTETLLHYFRKSDYAGWNIWGWTTSTDSGQTDFTGESDLGKTSFINKTSVIVRKGDWAEQTSTYSIPQEAKNVYIIDGDKKLYTNLKDAVNSMKPKVSKAIMDSKNEIKAYLTDQPLNSNTFALYKENVKVDGVNVNVNQSNNTVTFTNLPAHISPSDYLEVRATDMFLPAPVERRTVLNDYYYTGNDMGVIYNGDNINLRLWAPTACKVELMIYNSWDAQQESGTAIDMARDLNGTWKAVATKAQVNKKYYMYRLTFREGFDSSNNAINRITYAVDPYATAVGVNGDKGYLVDLNGSETTPDGWTSDKKPTFINPEDAVLYEMHIRDFTIDPSSGVDESSRGKYVGAGQTGTTYKDASGKTVSTGVDHLKDLGVTHVHLMPVYDYSSVDETNPSGDGNRNWGYDPKNFNVPEGSYSTAPYDPVARIKEFRQMVNSFHKSGIKLVTDVVYNHMADTSNMDKIVPGYYFRTDAYGNYTNGSGCGNEVASERPMIRKFIVDSVMNWAKTYNIDGFRFDLMSLIDTDTMNAITTTVKTNDPATIVYGEPWAAASSPLTNPAGYGTQKGNHYAVFNGVLRDALRGNNDPSKGFLNNGINADNSGKVVEGLKGSINGLTSDPEETINYLEAHDNYILWDQIEKTQTGVDHGNYRKNIPTDALNDWRVRQDVLASGMVLTAQGIPFFHAGSEILRTKQGDHNSYKSNDEINQIHWEDKAEYDEVFNYYKGLIQLRKEHPAFRMTNRDMINGSLNVYKANGTDGVIISHLKDNANGDKWKNIVVIYNATVSDWNFADASNTTGLPTPSGGKWHVVVNDQGVDLSGATTLEGRPVVKANSMLVMYDEEAEKKDLQWDYLFADQSSDYMQPMEPTKDENITVRFRAKAGEVTGANVHYFSTENNQENTVKMTKITDTTFYSSKGYDSSKIEFWEGIIPAGAGNKYYNFEVINSDAAKSAWISGGSGQNNRGITATAPKITPADPNSGIDHGFMIKPDYKTPTWSKESILYQIMVDRFRDGDTKNNRQPKDPSVGGNKSEVSNWGSELFNGEESDKVWSNQFFGGDLTGVQEAIPYLKNQLGVTGVYLMPIFQSNSDHKYDADTYDYVDKNFGGNLGLASLTKSFKDNNMNVILDGVFNHTSSEGQLFKDHHNNGTDKEFYFKGNYGNLDFFPWHGYDSLAKLDYSKDAVKNYMYKDENSILKRYLKAPYAIDGWRLDAAEDLAGMPRDYKDLKTEATDPTQKQQNLEIWQDIRANIKNVNTNNPNPYLLGEFWGNDNQWYNGKAWDGKMNYGGFLMPFVENRSENPWLGTQSLDNNGNVSVADIGTFTRNYFKGFPYQTLLNSTNSLSTHDKPRFLNMNYTGAGNDAMMELAAALQLTYPGVPMLYYGDEIGTVGKIRDTLEHKPFGSDPYNRGTFEWDSSKWNKNMFNDYRNLISTRKINKDAFVYGAFEEIASNKEGKYIAYARYGNNNRSITILNNKGGSAQVPITVDRLERYGFKEGDVLKDVLTGNKATVVNNSVVLPTRQMSAAVFVLEDKAPTLQSIGTADTAQLNDLNDGRTQLEEVKGCVTSISSSGDVNVEWTQYTNANAKDILVRLYDSNDKVCAEKAINISEKSCTFTGVGTNNYKVVLKAEADRSKLDNGVDDIYMDSIYTTANTVVDYTVLKAGVEAKVKAYEDLANADLSTQELIDAAKVAKGNIVTTDLKVEDIATFATRIATADEKVTVAQKVIDDAKKAAEEYTALKADVEAKVEGYETLANGDLSTQELIDEANTAKENIVTTGLTEADIVIFQTRIDIADVKVTTSQKVIDDAKKAATDYAELKAKVEADVKDYEALANGDLSTQILIDEANTAKKNIVTIGLTEADKDIFEERIALANTKVEVAQKVIDEAKKSAEEYTVLKAKVEAKVKAYEELANGDLSKQTLIDVANTAKGNIVTIGLTEVDIATFQTRIYVANQKVAVAQKVIDDAKKAVEYAALKAKVETEVKAYEDLANADLSTQALVEAANTAKGNIVITGLTEADVNTFKIRIASADVKVTASQKVIDDAKKSEADYSKLKAKVEAEVKVYEDLAKANLSTQILIDAAKIAKKNIVTTGLIEADIATFGTRIAVADEKVIAAQKVIDDAKKSEVDYAKLKAKVEAEVKVYEDLAKANLSTQILIDAAKIAKKNIVTTGLIEADIAILGTRIAGADEKVIVAQKVIDVASKAIVVNNFDSSSIISTIEKVLGKIAIGNIEIKVDAVENPKINKNVFNTIVGKDITIILQNKDVSWSFNGIDINKNNLKDIDISLNKEPEHKDLIINKLNTSNVNVSRDEQKLISFKNNGVLPGKASVKIKLDAQWLKDKDRNLIYFYYYNPSTNNFEKIEGPLKADENDYVTVNLTHCSDYMFTAKELTFNNSGSDSSANSNAAISGSVITDTNSNGNKVNNNNSASGNSNNIVKETNESNVKLIETKPNSSNNVNGNVIKSEITGTLNTNISKDNSISSNNDSNGESQQVNEKDKEVASNTDEINKQEKDNNNSESLNKAEKNDNETSKTQLSLHVKLLLITVIIAVCVIGILVIRRLRRKK